MEFPDWRLLILLGVFITGWVIARVDMRQMIRTAQQIPERLIRGLGNLMEDKRTAAAQDFLAAARPVDDGNAQLHLYAGELYRRHGDCEAAIRIHKRLLDNETLSAAMRERAKLELGLDYQLGGFLDLAEQCFSEVGEFGRVDAGVRHLFNIHLLRRDWQRAIADEEQFAAGDRDPELHRHVIAQLYCEWAKDEPARGAELLAAALERNPHCGRAWLMKAEAALERGAVSEALACLERLHPHADMLPLAAGLLVRAHAAHGTVEESQKLLSEKFANHPSELLFATAFEALAAVRGEEQLADFAALGMRLLSGPLPVTRWLRVKRRLADGEQREICEQALSALGKQEASYRCKSCSFSAPTHYWQCPACRLWETMGAVPAGRMHS